MESYEIAVKELKTCYDKFGIVAGKNQYEDYWTRDAYYGWVAAMELGDYEIVKKHLDMLKRFQKPNGIIPFIVRQNLPPLNFLGIKIKINPIPFYKSHKAFFKSYVIDSNHYYVLGAIKYYASSQDKEFLNSHINCMIKALKWYENLLDTDYLVNEGYIAQWNDGIYKRGKTLITNAQIYYTFKSLATFFYFNPDLDQKTGKHLYETSLKIKESLIEKFWNGKYMLDWVTPNDLGITYDTLGNMMAIIYDSVDKEKGNLILDFAEKYLISGELAKTSYPMYQYSLVDFFNKLFKLHEYWQGNKYYWPEPTLLMALAYNELGHNDKARALLNNFSELVIKNNGIFELYEKVNNEIIPVKTFNYKSEHPYSRGSGLFIHAVNTILN